VFVVYILYCFIWFLAITLINRAYTCFTIDYRPNNKVDGELETFIDL